MDFLDFLPYSVEVGTRNWSGSSFTTERRLGLETKLASFIELFRWGYCRRLLSLYRGCVIYVNVPQYLSYDFVKVNIRNSRIFVRNFITTTLRLVV